MLGNHVVSWCISNVADGRDLDLPREGRRRRRGSRDRRESDQLRSQSRKRRRQQGEVPDAKKIARQVAENLLSEDRQGEEEDEVEAVPNTELFVLGSSESYSYEWEERKAEELRKLEEERKEAELKAEEARREAEAAEAKQKEEEVALVRSSSQETSRLQHSQYALPCDHPFLISCRFCQADLEPSGSGAICSTLPASALCLCRGLVATQASMGESLWREGTAKISREPVGRTRTSAESRRGIGTEFGAWTTPLARFPQ
eukprot:g2451.t1